jgi:hypothetical protein
VRVPEGAGIGKAKVAVSFAGWEAGNVVPTTVELPVIGPANGGQAK